MHECRYMKQLRPNGQNIGVPNYNSTILPSKSA